MPIIRRRLKSSDVAPDNIRYNPGTDTTQSLIDGVWVDNPEADPRQQTTFPPRVTSDTKCDAAESVKDAFLGTVNDIITAIEGGKEAFTIAGIILGLFSFGVFAIFITIALFIANLMLDTGSAAINAALTPAVWHTFACILRCHMDANGRLFPGSMATISIEIDAQIGGIAATILNAMLSLAGEGGVNNLASLGTSTGSCADCGCSDDWCYLFDFENVSDGAWVRTTAEGDNNGTYSAGWNTSDAVNTALDPDVAQRLVNIRRVFASSRITRFVMFYDLTKGTFDVAGAVGLRLRINGSPVVNIPFSTLTNTTIGTALWEGDLNGVTELQAFIRSSRDQTAPYAYSGAAKIKSIRVEGIGTNPFGTSNC